MATPLPENEAERLRFLHQYKVLDSAADAMLDNLTRLAAAICDTPIGLVSLVDEHRQWFKSRVGLDVEETPREHAFCAHTILSDDLMVVGDAREDERFADNPLVTSSPSIRFYAGAPLVVAQGIRLGSLCVIDDKPRELSPPQLGALRVLRDAIVGQLELRRALNDLDTLQSYLPMCAWCRDIRDTDGEWQSLQQFVETAARVTHSICPKCARAMKNEASR
ncbi:MAG: GAF domain-containing protein [Candidatus Hydrogenedens sp.]|nr:GAF domain-containing protein [Candidatus Hydrogenedens sp.]